MSTNTVSPKSELGVEKSGWSKIEILGSGRAAGPAGQLGWGWARRLQNGEKSTFDDFSAFGRASVPIPTSIDVVWRVLTGSGEVLEVSGLKTGFFEQNSWSARSLQGCRRVW